MIQEGEGARQECKKKCSLYAVEISGNVQFSERTEMVRTDDHRERMEEMHAAWAEPCVGQEGG